MADPACSSGRRTREPVGGSRSRYNVLRSDDINDWLSADCVVAETINTWAPVDPVDPGPNQILYYLVGAKNECGVSTLGNDLGGNPRYGTACYSESEWW